MKKIYSILLILGLIAPNGVSAASSFSDVNDSYKYKNAVDYLFDEGVVSGNPDGTFRPYNSLNRAELTKIVIESLDIQTDSSVSCFPDVASGEWYTKYVCKAKELGWVQGYPDGTFKPANEINRAEAMKIIAEASDWDVEAPSSDPYPDVPKDEWFASYVSYALNNGFSPFSGSYDPAKAINRGEFSEIYYRILSGEVSDDSSEDDVEDEDTEVEVSDQVESSFSVESYEANSFDKVLLDEDFPKSYYENEVYYFEGEVTSGSYDSAFLFIYPEGDSSYMTTFSADLTSDTFSIPMYFDQAGTYNIGIIPGTSGTSKVAKVAVVKNDLFGSDEVDAPSKVSDFGISFSNNETVLTASSDADFIRFNFSQGSDSVSYFSRQDRSLAVRYSDFKDFNEGQVTYNVEVANHDGDSISNWVKSSDKTFSAVIHQYSEVTENIDITSLPDFHGSSSITISGRTDTALSGKFYAIKPNGTVYSSGSNSTINAGSNFSFSYSPSESGTHILEVNDTKGLAVINHPVYQSGKIPLVPDYFDLNPLYLDEDSSLDESADKNAMLSLVNSERSKHGLSSVSLDTELSALARSHSQDMADKNYFAHVNLVGESPNDRRIEAGIDTFVGENIAKTISTEYSHYALMRSAIHRANILRPEWTKVGLGIVKDNQGYFYVTQEFSFDEDEFEDKLADLINDERGTDLSEDSILADRALVWTQKMLDENFFDTAHDGESIFDGLDDGSFNNVQSIIVSGNSLSDLADLVISNSSIEDAQWLKYGFGVLVDTDGLAKISILYAR